VNHTGATQKSIVDLRLANARPHEAPVVFNANAATGEQISHGCNGFFGVFRARAYGKDKITEGKFRTWFEDLFGLFHVNLGKLEHIQCHYVQSRPCEGWIVAFAKRLGVLARQI
jgi:hypothetical protein